MKELYVWLQKEVYESLELLNTDIIKNGADEVVFSSSKEFLLQTNVLLTKLIDLLSEQDLDVIKLLTLISKLKCEGIDEDATELLQSMIFKMMKISALERK